MSKIKLSMLIILIAELSATGQRHFFVTPFIGRSVPVTSGDKSLSNANTPLNDFQFEYKMINYRKFTPITFGLKLEYQVGKSKFGFGFILGDETGSSYVAGISVFAANAPWSGNKGYAVHGGYVGRALTKIPISYNFKLLSAHHIGNSKHFFHLSLHTGANIFLIKKWNQNSFDYMKPFNYGGQNGFMIQPYAHEYTTPEGNIAENVSWECNLQKGWSVSFDVGLEMGWYIKNKRRFTTILYYEQGTRNVSAIVNEIYFNGLFQGTNAVYSRGSAIQFKLVFPIEILKKYSARMSEN